MVPNGHLERAGEAPFARTRACVPLTRPPFRIRTCTETAKPTRKPPKFSLQKCEKEIRSLVAQPRVKKNRN